MWSLAWLQALKIMRCCSCRHQWQSHTAETACIKCGHLYVEWLNHKLWTER